MLAAGRFFPVGCVVVGCVPPERIPYLCGEIAQARNAPPPVAVLGECEPTQCGVLEWMARNAPYFLLRQGGYDVVILTLFEFSA